MKQVCILGLGQFGGHLARELAKMNCEVIAVDADENRINEIRDQVHHAIIADAGNFNELKQIVSPEFDEVILAFSENMESSILAALHLKKLGLKYVRAKAFDADHAEILRLIGIDEIIFPERDTADRLAANIVMPNYLDFLPITDEYRVVELAVPEGFINKTLAEADIRNRYHIMILAVKDTASNDVRFMPGANFTLQKEHILVVVGKIDDVNLLSENR